MMVYLIAGEPSGDRLGAALMAGLKTLRPNIEFKGVAGPLMQAEGMHSLFDMSELSVMGLAEILPKYCHLKRRIRETAADVLAQKPDVLITIDSPDFSFRAAKQVKAQSNIKTVHYVAPTVWAWRPGRAAKMARFIDHVLALFPFEPDYMTAAGMGCDFVGHPVVSEPVPTPDEVARFKADHGLNQAKSLAVLAGSRMGEVGRLMPVFTAVLAKPEFCDTRLIFPTLPHLADKIRDQLRVLPQPVTILDGQGQSAVEAAQSRRIALAAADAALAASGTISLELAAASTPMVIAYDMSPLSRLIISAMLRTDTVTLVNLVTETRLVPEFIGQNCQPGLIAPALQAVLDGNHAQSPVLAETMKRLGQGAEPPGLRAARAVLKVVQA